LGSLVRSLQVGLYIVIPFTVLLMHSLVPAARDVKHASKQEVGCNDGILVKSLKWMGPYSPAFYSNGKRHSSFYSLKEAKVACEAALTCEGVTGAWSPAKIPEEEWVWELRARKPSREVMWISPSSSEEVTYVYNRNLSLLNVCCPKKFTSMLPVFYINLGYRADRRRNLLSNLASKGVDVVRSVSRQNGINRSLYETATDILVAWKQPLTSSSVWKGQLINGKPPNTRSERFKGKVASWVAHRVVWERIMRARNFPRGAWFLILEDDVRMMDSVEAFLDKMSATLCLYPHADMIYLTGREVPPLLPGNMVAYMGVDAYAVSSRAIPKLLNSTVLGKLLVVNTTALDAYLSALVLADIIDARMVVGGNPFVNSWKQFKSDIEVRG